jgi:hypothetical protein
LEWIIKLKMGRFLQHYMSKCPLNSDPEPAGFGSDDYAFPAEAKRLKR